MNELSKNRILVVTADVLLRKYLADLLLSHFTTVEFYSSPQHALDRMTTCELDVVICDYLNSEMDGVEFRSQMTLKTNTPHFILLTANANEPKIVQRLEQDEFHILQKPPHPDELVLAMKAWFKNKNAA